MVSQDILTARTEGIFSKRNFHCKYLHDIQLECLVVHRRACLRDKRISSVINHIGDIHTNTLTHKRMVAFCVDHITLLVHHVIILDEAFTNTEVVLLHFLLCTLNRRRDHVMFNHLALLEAHLIHQACQAVRTEHTHQVILHTHIEYTATWVTLTTCTTTQLTVHTTALVTLGTNDSQTTCILHLFSKLDIGTTTCHVGSNGNNTWTTCLSHHVRLVLVQLSVEDIVLDLAEGEQLTQQLTDFHRSCTYKHRATSFNQFFHLFDNRIVFLAFGTINTIVHILASDRAVGWDNYHIQFIDIVELTCFRFSSTSHTR